MWEFRGIDAGSRYPNVGVRAAKFVSYSYFPRSLREFLLRATLRVSIQSVRVGAVILTNLCIFLGKCNDYARVIMIGLGEVGWGRCVSQRRRRPFASPQEGEARTCRRFVGWDKAASVKWFVERQQGGLARHEVLEGALAIPT